MKYIRTFTLLAIASMPAVAWGSSGITIINNIAARSNHALEAVTAVGADGQSVSSSVRGADGADGQDGTVIQGGSSSHVDVHTEINGKTVEDTHTTVRQGDVPAVEHHVFEEDGVRVETYINAKAGSATSSRATSYDTMNVSQQAGKVKEKADILFQDTRTVAPITNHITEGTDTLATAGAAPMAVQQLRRILSNIFTYVSTIFAYESRQHVLATHESFAHQFDGFLWRPCGIVCPDRHFV